jgi:hypothetical protein
MADECFGHPRLAAVYDPLDPDRGDLDAYLGIAQELKARTALKAWVTLPSLRGLVQRLNPLCLPDPGFA